MRFLFTVITTAAVAVWAVGEKLNKVGVGLRQEIGAVRQDMSRVEVGLRQEIGAVRQDMSKMEVGLRQEIGALREQVARFEGTTTATLQQLSGQMQQLLQLALEKK